MVRAIYLSCCAKTLAGRATDYQIHPVCANKLLQISRGEFSEIFLKNLGNVFEIRPKHFDGFLVEVYGGQPSESRPLQPEAETAASAEKVEESGLG